MPIKPEVALEFFGIDPEQFENDDAFREAAAKDWTKVTEAAKDPEVMKHVTGRMNGVIGGNLKKAFKALELPTEGIDFDKPADAVLVLADTAKKTWGERQKQLEESLKGKGSEEAKKEFERQIAELSKKASDFETLTGTLRGEIDARDKAEKQREISGKIDGEWQQAEMTALKDVKFKNDLEKKGFQSAARERFQVRFDEKGASYWAGKDGNRIQDGSKHQAFKDGAQLLKELAAELKVGDSNPRGGEPVRQRVATTERPVSDGIIRKVNRIATPGRALSDVPG